MSLSYVENKKREDAFHEYLNTLRPHIGFFGGRSFYSLQDKKNVKYNSLLKKTEEIFLENHLNIFEKYKTIQKLQNLKMQTDTLLHSKKTKKIQRILTYIRSFFGNLFFHRTRIERDIYKLFVKVKFNRIETDNLFTGPCGGTYIRDFYKALNANQSLTITEEIIQKKDDRAEWLQLKIQYEEFCARLEQSLDDEIAYKIPKKIHVVWLGDNVPEDVIRVKESWENYHPSWETKLWRDQDCEKLIFEIRKEYPNVGIAWDKAKTKAELADLIRYSVLYKEGGIYVDSDLPCFDKVDDLHCQSDFFVGMEQNDHPHNIIYVGNAVIGVKPGHLAMKRCLETVRPQEENEDTWAVISRTGPGLLTDRIYEALRSSDREYDKMVILPPSYFYPLPSGLRLHAMKKRNFAKNMLCPWSKGLHLWNLSWIEETSEQGNRK